MPTTNFSASWAQVDRTTDPGFYSALLEATRAQALELARRDPAAAFGPLELRPGLRVLDVGCGTGDYLRLLAPRVAHGTAVGIDLSATLIDHAQRQTGADQLNLTYQVGDAYELPFDDGTFDRVICSQVLLHLTDPWRALTEMRRVLSSSGRLSIGEWDWDSICLALTDRDLGRRFTHLLCDNMTNGLIVRDLAWQLGQHGFGSVTVMPEVRLTRDLDAAQAWLIEPTTRELVRTGALSPKDGQRLLDDLHQRAESGRYFLARTHYTFLATDS